MSLWCIASALGGFAAACLVIVVAFAVRDSFIPAKLPPDQENVRWAYRMVLKREPESYRTLVWWARKRHTRKELIFHFAQTQEFRAKSQAERETLVNNAHDQIYA